MRFRSWLGRPFVVGAAVAVLAFGFAVAALSRYGMTYDSPALFYSGDRTLFWLGHRDVPKALDLRGPNPPGFTTIFTASPSPGDPVSYPAFASMTAAVTARLFPGLEPVDGHHLGLVLLHALALLGYCVYACRLLGRGAGIAATVALALFPSALGHSFNNAKDWPCAQLYGLAVLAFGCGVVEARARDVVWAGVFLGLAAGCKINALFALATVLVWTPFAYLWLYRGRRDVWKIGAAALLVPYLAGALFVALWPWLYWDGLRSILPRVAEYFTYCLDKGKSPRATWDFQPLRCVAYMTPPIVLAALAVGLGVGWRDPRQRAVNLLLVLWLVIPLVRVAVPHVMFYDSNRHFIEYVPALCAIAGRGAAWVGGRVAARWPRLPLALGVLALAALVWPIAQYFPYQVTYFNVLAGGLGGAQRRAVIGDGSEGDYWFGSVRQAMRDLEGRAGPDDVIAVCGPFKYLADENLAPGRTMTVVDHTDRRYAAASFMYVAPRQRLCNWKEVRDLEAEREVLQRVERDGGLVYELLGARRATRGEPVSAGGAYAR